MIIHHILVASGTGEFHPYLLERSDIGYAVRRMVSAVVTGRCFSRRLLMPATKGFAANVIGRDTYAPVLQFNPSASHLPASYDADNCDRKITIPLQWKYTSSEHPDRHVHHPLGCAR